MLLNFSLISAGAGFFISFVSGLFGGVGFLDVLLRALIFAIVFAGLGAGLFLLLQSQFPDLLDMGGQLPSQPNEESITGTKVDIVLPEEAPTSPYEEDEGVEEIRESAGRQESATGVSASALQEESSSTEETSGPPAQTPKSSQESDRVQDPLGEDSDELPDLGAFADSFQDAEVSGSPDGETGNNEEESSSNLGGSGESTVTFEGEEHDPEIMAQAVRTALKRDQGGK